MVSRGIAENEARKKLADWANEEVYFPLPVEIDAMKAAGFEVVDVVWRRTPMAVILAKKN